MATGILVNHLDIAAVNALVIWLCKDPTWNAKKSSLFFARIGFALIRPQMERHLMQLGMCLGETFRGENMFGELSGLGKYPGKRPGRNVGIPMQDYKFIRVAEMVCANLVT